ncbi:hypothetical protein GCM10010206_18130 [Streptomyces cinerochromogenes]|nr:hypothetical protein GCM10010206_18130 [Streptomyces cinerochromogenes]
MGHLVVAMGMVRQRGGTRRASERVPAVVPRYVEVVDQWEDPPNPGTTPQHPGAGPGPSPAALKSVSFRPGAGWSWGGRGPRVSF